MCSFVYSGGLHYPRYLLPRSPPGRPEECPPPSFKAGVSRKPLLTSTKSTVWTLVSRTIGPNLRPLRLLKRRHVPYRGWSLGGSGFTTAVPPALCHSRYVPSPDRPSRSHQCLRRDSSTRNSTQVPHLSVVGKGLPGLFLVRSSFPLTDGVHPLETWDTSLSPAVRLSVVQGTKYT